VTRVIAAAANIFFSLLLGSIALAFCAVVFPQLVDSMINFASEIKSSITSAGIPVQYNIWIKLIFKEESLVLMFFVIIMRILFALLVWMISSMLGGSQKA